MSFPGGAKGNHPGRNGKTDQSSPNRRCTFGPDGFYAVCLRQSTVHGTLKGPLLLCNGAPKNVVFSCTRILIGGKGTILLSNSAERHPGNADIHVRAGDARGGLGLSDVEERSPGGAVERY